MSDSVIEIYEQPVTIDEIMICYDEQACPEYCDEAVPGGQCGMERRWSCRDRACRCGAGHLTGAARRNILYRLKLELDAAKVAALFERIERLRAAVQAANIKLDEASAQDVAGLVREVWGPGAG